MYSNLTGFFGGTPASSLGVSLGLTFSLSLGQIYSFTRLATLMVVVMTLAILNMTNPANCQVCAVSCIYVSTSRCSNFDVPKVLILLSHVSISYNFVLPCTPMSPILDKSLHSLSPYLPDLWIHYLYPFFSIDRTPHVCLSLVLSLFCYSPKETLMSLPYQNRYLELE